MPGTSTVFHRQQPSGLGIFFPNHCPLFNGVHTSVFSHHFPCSPSRPSESAPTQLTNHLKDSKTHYQEQCKRCHESLLGQLPRPTILLLIYLLEAAEVEVQNTSIDQAESAGRERGGTIMPVVQAAVSHMPHSEISFTHSREEAKRSSFPATLPRQLNHFLQRAPPGELARLG